MDSTVDILAAPRRYQATLKHPTISVSVLSAWTVCSTVRVHVDRYASGAVETGSRDETFCQGRRRTDDKMFEAMV